ncbi:MAG: aryl-sulfate sulfotransferase [Verrucomicrobia bacterium]|nr:aryl-sulfate sulfotransferase [Verrucomicrobiota bacterium]MDA1065034.1 aryl-sulfate sulfotransferase [Verrucomicrobiota bacterium]
MHSFIKYIFISSLLGIFTSQVSARGLIKNEPGAFQGYTLYTPLRSTDTVLLNMKGEVVHKWVSKNWPSNSVYLLPNGNLLRCAKVRGNEVFGERGPSGGRVELFDWDGKQLWDYVYSNNEHHQHHDIEPLPNGNVLILAWERISKENAIAAGRNPEGVGDAGIFPDTVVEVKRTGQTTGEVVWRWSAWDHLVQDVDPSKANYGHVAAHPELIDANLNGRPRTDWMHSNGINYNPVLDQIVISARSFDEILVIDHSTTTEEARGHTGGLAGKGGDILYRWGNPANYRAGGPEDQTLFQQHDARWVHAGEPGAGNITIFNNLKGQSGINYSSVDEIKTPIERNGSYQIKKGEAFEPKIANWSYTATNPNDFYSSFISGAERLPNGNTLICSGAEGIFFEVTPEGKTVWEYHNPIELPPVGPEGPHSVFRVVRYRLDYPGVSRLMQAP